MLEEFIRQWGYLGVFVAALVEGEVFLLAAGAYAHAGLLSLPLVVLAATAGSLVWGQGWFYIGRLFGVAVIEQRPKWRERARAVEEWIRRYGDLLVFGFRFVPGLEIVLPLLIGATGYSPNRFFVLDALGAVVWALAFTCLGLAASAGLTRLFQDRIEGPILVTIGLAVVLVLLLLVRAWRAFKKRRVESKSESPVRD